MTPLDKLQKQAAEDMAAYRRTWHRDGPGRRFGSQSSDAVRARRQKVGAMAEAGMKIKEIARDMGLTIGTVKSDLSSYRASKK